MDSYGEESVDDLSGDEQLLHVEDLFEDDGDENLQPLNNDNEDGNEGGKKGEDESALKRGKRRVVRNPRVLLNVERLTSANGIESLAETFRNFRFRGKHREKEDLTEMMQNMQHWMCHHLYPGYDAETSMRILEKLGKKRVVQNHMKRLRSEGMAKVVERGCRGSDPDAEFASVVSNEDNFDEVPLAMPEEATPFRDVEGGISSSSFQRTASETIGSDDW